MARYSCVGIGVSQAAIAPHLSNDSVDELKSSLLLSETGHWTPREKGMLLTLPKAAYLSWWKSVESLQSQLHQSPSVAKGVQL